MKEIEIASLDELITKMCEAPEELSAEDYLSLMLEVERVTAADNPPQAKLQGLADKMSVGTRARLQSRALCEAFSLQYREPDSLVE